MAVIGFSAKRLDLPRIEEKVTFRQVVKATQNAFLALLMPVIILGGILGGLATPTESAGIAAFYAFIVGVLIRRTISLRKLYQVFVQSTITTAGVMILLGTASLFSYILTIEMFPDKVAELVLALTSNKYLILLLVNIILLVIGMFLDVVPALLVMTPVFLPLMESIGIHPLHFGAFCVLNLVIGLATPPVGMCLFVSANIGKISIERVAVALFPFLAAVIGVLLFLTYVPQAVMWLPHVFGYAL